MGVGGGGIDTLYLLEQHNQGLSFESQVLSLQFRVSRHFHEKNFSRKLFISQVFQMHITIGTREK